MPKIVLLLESGRSFDRELLKGIGQYSRLHGPWAFHIVSEKLDEVMPPATFWDGSGVIARLDSQRLARAVNSAKVPVVVVDSTGTLSAGHSSNRIADVFVDLEGVVRLAIEHFSSLGLKQFAYVGMPNRGGADRKHRDINETAKRTQQPFIVYPPDGSCGSFSIHEGHSFAEWLEQLPKPIGIIACDDERGLQVLEACRRAQINVPHEVAVIGVGNDELLCAMADPPLTSVALNGVNGGYRAAHALDHLMRQSVHSPQQLIIEPNSVIVRSSTDTDVSHDAHVNAARSIIRRHFARDLSVDALAKSVGISRRMLEVKYRKHLGRTILEEIQQVRLASARMMLEETALPLAQIASLSGYHSVSYLVQVFGREFGLTPCKYRMASRVSEPYHKSWAVGRINTDSA